MNMNLVVFAYGGIYPQTHDCVIRDLATDVCKGHHVEYATQFNDALIDRCRSTVATRFLETSKNDVLVMIDHDIEWAPGDFFRVAAKALELNAIVGAAVAKRTKNQGIATRLKDKPEKLQLPPNDVLLEAYYVGSAFTAYPRCILQTVANTMQKTDQGFWPLYQPMTAQHTDPDKWDELEYLSEDWALCRRATDIGFKSYIDMWPRTAHHGHKAWTLMDAFEDKLIVEGNKQNENINTSRD